MLRFNDEKGLLKPAKVDRDTGYRYYDDNSVIIAQQIMIYKNCGLSLEETRKIVVSSCPDQESLYKVLTARLKEIELLSISIDQSRIRLEQMINDLRADKYEKPEMIELETISGIYKEVDMSDENGVSRILSELYAWGALSGLSFIQPHLILHNVADDKISNDDKESQVFARTANQAEGDAKQGIYPLSLAESKGVRIIHRGSFFSSGDTWKRLFRYIEENQLAITGYGRETKNMTGPSVTIEVPVKELLS